VRVKVTFEWFVSNCNKACYFIIIIIIIAIIIIKRCKKSLAVDPLWPVFIDKTIMQQNRVQSLPHNRDLLEQQIIIIIIITIIITGIKF